MRVATTICNEIRGHRRALVIEASEIVRAHEGRLTVTLGAGETVLTVRAPADSSLGR